MALAAVAAGCGGSDWAAPAPPANVEIFSWWVSGTETKALSAMVDVYETDYPGMGVVNAAGAEPADAKQELEDRMMQGLPPDTFQVSGGNDLLHWVAFNGEDDSASKLDPIETLGNASEWLRAVPKAVTDLVSHDGHVYAVPLDISRTNCLFYNKKIFAENHLPPPRTLEEFFTVADVLQAKGITPLVVGARESWTVATVVWETVLVASAGSRYYRDFFAGKRSANDPELRTALEAAARMLGYVDGDHNSLTWNDAAARVLQGTAAMNIMGDWAKGELIADGGVPDVDFGEVSLGVGSFVFTMDTFPLPHGAPDRDAAIGLLTTMGSVSGQNAFSPVKGSIPARIDADESLFDPLGRQTMEAFRTDTLVPATSAVVPAAFSIPTNAALGAFIDDLNVDNMILAVKNHYDALKAP